jgi:hypothetical protein
MADLIRISRTKADPGIPFAPATLYKWMHLGKNPELFVKIGGALFLDRAKLAELIENSRVNDAKCSCRRGRK